MGNPEYFDANDRFQSFTTWSNLDNKVKPQELSEAGFYYLGIGDSVKCFSCGGCLKDWEKNDDPWKEHARWFGGCKYLKQCKGSEFVKSLNDQYEDSGLCIICCARRANCAIIPCFHIATCIRCPKSLINCPICRVPIESFKRVYYS